MRKYGADAHVFEIVEECAIEMLNERERYWQEHYNVLCQHKGLNCRLTTTNDKSGMFSKETCMRISEANRRKVVKQSTRDKFKVRCTGGGNPRVLVVFNTETGIYYDCVKDAAHTINVTRKTLSNRLNGLQYNHTSFRYVDLIKNDILVHKCDVNPKKGGHNATIVLNTETGIYYDNMAEAGVSVNKGWHPVFKSIHGLAKRKKLPFVKA